MATSKNELINTELNGFNKVESNENIIKFNNQTIREAVKLWLDDENEAMELYGHISKWDTSEVTKMNGLFKDAKSFNDDIGTWDESTVKDI